MIIASVAVVATAGIAIAGSHGGNPAVKARQAHMSLYAFNMATLGGMAKGEIEYNADAAKAAAGNMAALSTLAQGAYWVPGTSTAELGEETRALPKIWEAGSTAGEIGGRMAEAAQQLAAVAGDGKDAMAGALGGVGKECSACHKGYRQPQE
ncbi:MAG: cytochrome c [Silicimonas sp.]|nr:cytochrome c [Silicimonas sp.]